MNRKAAFGFRGWYRHMLNKGDEQLIGKLEHLRLVKKLNFAAFAVDAKELPHYQQLMDAYLRYIRDVCGDFFSICIYSEPKLKMRGKKYAKERLLGVYPVGVQCVAEALKGLKRTDVLRGADESDARAEDALRAPPYGAG